MSQEALKKHSPQLRSNDLPEWASDIQLANYYNVHRSTIWRWAKGWVTKTKNGEERWNTPIIPPPTMIGANCARWRLSLVIQRLEG